MDTPGVILYTLYRCWGCFVKGFFDLQSAEFPGTCPALCICSFPLRGLYRTYVRCPACAPESVRVYFGTCPVSCICTGTVRLLLVFSFVCPGFCLCNCAVATASRLAGAVREKGDGLCGALLLSLRHLSTEPRLRGSPLAAGMIRLPRVYRDIVCAIPVRSLVATSM